MSYKLNPLQMKKPLLLIAAACIALGANAQYTFNTFIESYETLDNATEIVENDFDENIWDDPEFQIEIGFSFPVGDQEYTSLSQDGLGAFLWMQNTSSETIFTYDSDLIDAELETPLSPSIISYVTEGEVGSRILKVQYENCGFYDIIEGEGVLGGEVQNRVNFQMWFHENGTFEMRFGSNSITDNLGAHFGPGPSIFLVADADLVEEDYYYFAGLSGNPEDPTVILNPSDDEEPPTLNGNPSDGRVFQFAPNSVGVGEISISNLKLYPTKVEQTIFIDGLELPNTNYRIVDITGKVQMTGMANQGEGIDVSKLNNGLYLFQAEGYSNALKFVKLK